MNTVSKNQIICNTNLKRILLKTHRGMEEWEKLASDKFFRQATMNELDE